VVFDSVATFREISVLRKQPHFLRKFTDARWLLGKTRATETILRTIPRVIVEQALMLGVLAFVGWQLFQGDLSSGLASVGIFVAGAVRIMGAVLPVQTSLATIKSNEVKAEKAQDILLKHREKIAWRYEPGAPVRRKKTRNLEPEGGIHEPGKGLGVVVDGVSFRYADADEDIVRDVSLRIEPGSFVAFVGPSGAGKTTLVDIVLGLNIPHTGSVQVAGSDPLALRVKNPGLISYVPQSPGMVQGSIAENVALGVSPEKIDMERVRECLHLVDLQKTVEALPEGINTSLGKQSDALSGGQLQRLGLARALYPRPRLIALDEATSALDAGSEHAVSQNIHNLGEDVTVIVIAHRLSTIQNADQVFVVEAGQISGSGTFKQVRKQVPMIEEYVKLMSFDE
jgi:ATP-binding cassette subfamily C protein